MQDNKTLQGKVALVTGASKGIGAAIAQVLAAQGAAVVVNSRKEADIKAVADQIEAQGGQALAVAGQVGLAADRHHIYNKVMERFGRLDILVNNAATNPVFGPVEQTEEAAFDKIMQVNVKAPFELAKLFLPQMRAQGSGSVINISSIGGVSPEAGLGIYSVSKAALISLTKVMAQEWGKDGIRANVICPGLIQTKFSEALWQNDKILRHVLANVPLGRMGQPEEMAGLCLFLASDASSYCTGGVYMADGGYLV